MNRLFFRLLCFYQFSLQAKIIGLKYCYIFRMRGENMGNFRQNKKLNDDCSTLSFYLCTQSRDRTGMEVNPLVFETSASTDSAIWA